MFPTFKSLIEAWPSTYLYAKDIGVSYNAAKQMRRRDSIAPQYFSRIVHRAAERGIEGISLEVLQKLRWEQLVARRAGSRPHQREARGRARVAP